MKKQKNISFRKQDERAGWLFTLPWAFGLFFFFIRPFFSAIVYSFGDPSIQLGSIKLNYVGFKNYIEAFTKDVEFPRMLAENIGSLILDVLIILCFSLFVGIILKSDFKGRTFARALFFFPVIVTSGLTLDVLSNNTVAQMLLSGSGSAAVQVDSFADICISWGLPSAIVTFLSDIVSNIFELTWKSGVQILLFLAGLQGIPSHLYEVSKVEGATAWERFWKVTFPLLMPTVILNIVYTVIDQFTDYGNEIMVYITNMAQLMKIGYSSALALLYFVIVLLISGLAYLIIRKASGLNT